MYDGIHLDRYSDSNKIGMNIVKLNNVGINLTSTSNSNQLTSNYIANNTNIALSVNASHLNEIIDNELQYSIFGVYLTGSNNNTLYHNNLKNNSQANASDDDSNQWDNGLEGNWWGDNPDLTDYDGNGICDNSYSGSTFTDFKPLVYENNDRVLVDDPWFWFIQSGVNFAEPGWTVYATSSTYFENVTINKTLTVTGEDRYSTIIDARGNDSVVLVDSTSYVNISGFTVQGGNYGIHLNNSNNCVLNNNYMTYNDIGVNLNNSNYNNIANNTISFNDLGIHVMNSNGTIEYNDITYNDIGLNITNSNDHMIANNTISHNDGGIQLTDSDVIIEFNNITYNDGGARAMNSTTIFRYNDISFNREGLADINYSHAIILNNTILNNSYAGIVNMYCSNGTMNNNTISYNYYGISCLEYSSPIITYNNITFNDYGIDSSYGANASVHWNNIHNNTIYNITNADSSITINATDNYWGADPPNEDGIDGQIIYEPYQTSPIDERGPQ
jgi:parallel beta-helix repeat protein